MRTSRRHNLHLWSHNVARLLTGHAMLPRRHGCETNGLGRRAYRATYGRITVSKCSLLMLWLQEAQEAPSHQTISCEGYRYGCQGPSKYPRNSEIRDGKNGSYIDANAVIYDMD